MALEFVSKENLEDIEAWSNVKNPCREIPLSLTDYSGNFWFEHAAKMADKNWTFTKWKKFII